MCFFFGGGVYMGVYRNNNPQAIGLQGRCRRTQRPGCLAQVEKGTYLDLRAVVNSRGYQPYRARGTVPPDKPSGRAIAALLWLSLLWLPLVATGKSLLGTCLHFMSDRPGEEDPERTGSKRKGPRLDSTGRPFVHTERGGKKIKRQQELRQAVLEGTYTPQEQWSEEKRLQYAKLLSIQERRRELDRLEREAQEGFVAAGEVPSSASGVATGGSDRLAVGPSAGPARVEGEEEERERERERSPRHVAARPIPSSSVSSDRPSPSVALAPTRPKRPNLPKPTRIPPTPLPTSAPETPVDLPQSPDISVKKATAKPSKSTGSSGKGAQDPPKLKEKGLPKASTKARPKSPKKPATKEPKAVPKEVPTKARPKEVPSASRPKAPPAKASLVVPEVAVNPDTSEAPKAAPARTSVSAKAPVVLRPRAGALSDPRSSGVKGSKGKDKRATEAVESSSGTIRVILDYHGVLDCDVAASVRKGKTWYCDTGIPRQTQDKLLAALDQTPGLEFLVLSYIGKGSYARRQDVINKVRAFAREAEARGHVGKVKISICDKRESKEGVAKDTKATVGVDDNWYIVESYQEHTRRAYWFAPNPAEEDPPKGCYWSFSWDKVLGFVKGCTRTPTPAEWENLRSAA